ncbi:hypothetical protein GBAR_LOCUS28537 [Geodia barretti]|uniref:Uncharacterized protein n=1 Tax=Geodia barretti TaxID=519541 RepID=A0AA35TQZ1_GEOBA|nr:hypothetical protein GBAR_LOCUS28537 [Geodia barretti]
MMAATEKRYENCEHERGAVTASVPEDFTDLSTVHHSLGSLSVQEGGESGDDWISHQLSQEQVDQFWRDGYLSNIPVLAQKQVQLLLKDYKTFLDPPTLLQTKVTAVSEFSSP